MTQLIQLTQTDGNRVAVCRFTICLVSEHKEGCVLHLRLDDEDAILEVRENFDTIMARCARADAPPPMSGDRPWSQQPWYDNDDD